MNIRAEIAVGRPASSRVVDKCAFSASPTVLKEILT